MIQTYMVNKPTSAFLIKLGRLVGIHKTTYKHPNIFIWTGGPCHMSDRDFLGVSSLVKENLALE